MMALSKLFPTFLPLGSLLLALGSTASPIIAPVAIEKRITDTSRQSRWTVVLEQVCNNGMQVLCQSILPHIPKTENVDDTSDFSALVSSDPALVNTATDDTPIVVVATAVQSAIERAQATPISSISDSMPNNRIYRESVSPDVIVARLSNTDILGFDLPETQGGSGTIGVDSETACIQACYLTSQCFGYFWWPTFRRCYLKGSGWSRDDFQTNTALAQDAGSVVGILGWTCAALRPSLTEVVHLRCCND